MKLNLDQFCRNGEIQQQVMEIVLILQLCPKKSRVKFPAVQPETHSNDNWLRSVLRTTDKASVRAVWQRNTDQEQMLHAGNEMVFAIIEGSPERALFWIKWLQEEDSIAKKQYGSGLSTAERAHAIGKNRTKVGFYLINVLTQLYKEMAETAQVRLHQEYQKLLYLYRDHDTSQKHRNDLIGIMVQLLCEVPAAPSLVQDPGTMQRIVALTNS